MSSQVEVYVPSWNSQVDPAGATVMHIFSGPDNQEVNPEAGNFVWRLRQAIFRHLWVSRL